MFAYAHLQVVTPAEFILWPNTEVSSFPLKFPFHQFWTCQHMHLQLLPFIIQNMLLDHFCECKRPYYCYSIFSFFRPSFTRKLNSSKDCYRYTLTIGTSCLSISCWWDINANNWITQLDSGLPYCPFRASASPSFFGCHHFQSGKKDRKRYRVTRWRVLEVLIAILYGQ